MIVIYHASCIDGFTAAWCAWLKYGDAATYIPAQYGEPPPPVLDDDVLIVDFSYPALTLFEMKRQSSGNFRVLDHHKTAEAELAGLDFCTFDMNRSGAGLAWDVLHGSARPALVDYVEDRDLWRWKLENSRETSAFISSFKPGFAQWNELRDDINYRIESCWSQGGAILRALNGYVEGMSGKYSWATIGGYGVPVINTTHGISELVGRLALMANESRNAPFAAGWFQKQDGKFVYSLRSRGDFDVSEVAKQYGGGGHKNAAGFTADALIPVEAP